jgi:CBS domain containing-hemolysin-like protein
MSMLSILLSLLGFVLLTLGTAVFVAAEFSLTALAQHRRRQRRHGGRRDKMVQRATARCRSSCPAPRSASRSPP